MKWTMQQGVWKDENWETGVPNGLPEKHPDGRPWKDWDYFNESDDSDGDDTVADDGPVGYTKVTSFGRDIWLKDVHGYLDNENIAIDHLVEGAHEGNGWHTSSKISGASSSDYYLHPSKGDPTLYLMDQSVGARKKHTDGLPMIEILRAGNVNGGNHKF